MSITLHRPGWIVRGSVFDSNPRRISRELRDYDPKLRLIWNPDSLEGVGRWELHWSPSWTVWAHEGDLDWTSALYSMRKLEATKKTLLNLRDDKGEVMNLKYLPCNILEEIKARDSWARVKDQTEAAEALEKHYTDQEEAEEKRVMDQIRRETRDQLREERKILKDYKDFVASGVNPLWFFQD
jgi:hypothetical protein